tara:strand:+ start:64 stop:357 length:294 start_codon:yes stop_codon:yes gene_type:complete
MTNFDSWLNTDSQYDANELAQCVIDDRINVLIKNTFKPADLITELEFTSDDQIKMAEFINENDMYGLGNYMYLKAYDYAYECADKQATLEYNNGDLA